MRNSPLSLLSNASGDDEMTAQSPHLSTGSIARSHSLLPLHAIATILANALGQSACTEITMLKVHEPRLVRRRVFQKCCLFEVSFVPKFAFPLSTLQLQRPPLYGKCFPGYPLFPCLIEGTEKGGSFSFPILSFDLVPTLIPVPNRNSPRNISVLKQFRSCERPTFVEERFILVTLTDIHSHLT